MDFNAKHNHIISIKAEDGGASSPEEKQDIPLRIFDCLFLSPMQV